MNAQLESTFMTGVEQNQHKLLRICSVYAENDDDKKDLFQESLIQIWQSMPSFQERCSLNTWMFRITLNVCMRLQSKETRKRKQFMKIETVREVDNIRADENPEEHERLSQLRNCIKKLNDADKAVITLYLEELPYSEISGITGLSENNVAVKLKRIKSKLLNCIIETP